jgi:hypothetical protein
VEYLFKNSVSHKPSTLVLSEFNMSVQSMAEERSISYASIVSLRLSKSNSFYKAIITADGETPIQITNRFYRSDGSFEDRSRQYETFIRVLHFHLKEKSGADFCTGCSWGKMILAGISTIFGALVLSLGLYFLKINFIDVVTQSFLLATLFIGFLLAAFWPHFPKAYQPEHIPSQFLP